MVELVVTADLKSAGFGRGGSSPPTRTKIMDDFKEKLEYALTQARPFHTVRRYPYDDGEATAFNGVIEEIVKLDLLPKGAYERLLIK